MLAVGGRGAGRAAPCVRAEQGKATRRANSRSDISGKTAFMGLLTSSDITELAHSLLELTVTTTIVFAHVIHIHMHYIYMTLIVHVRVQSFPGPAPFWKRVGMELHAAIHVYTVYIHMHVYL